jgi:hypothetical protein
MVARSLAIIASAARQSFGFIAMNAARVSMPRSLALAAGAHGDRRYDDPRHSFGG